MRKQRGGSREQKDGSERLDAMVLREAVKSDLGAINEIYNHYVVHSNCTYQEEPETMENRRLWFERHGPKHPIIVAVFNGDVLGWGSLSPYHPRSAYRYTVENSVYVHAKHQRRGIGSRLLSDLIVRAQKAGHHAIMALIDSQQKGSIALHSKFKFKTAGRVREVGRKFGRWLDVVYMERLL